MLTIDSGAGQSVPKSSLRNHRHPANAVLSPNGFCYQQWINGAQNDKEFSGRATSRNYTVVQNDSAKIQEK